MKAALAALALTACTASVTRPATAPTSAAASDAAAPPAIAAPEPPPPPRPPAPPPTAITVEYLAVADAWAITWTVGRPAAALRFDRALAAPRGAAWRTSAELAWRRDGEDDLLVAVDGQPRQAFTAVVPSDDASPTRLPPVVVRWSDGSRLVFTGAIGGDAAVCVQDRCGPVAGARTWTVRAPGLRVARGLGDAAEQLAWDEADGDRRGGYVYVGRGRVDARGDVAAIVDRGLPPWLAALTATLVPATVADLTARTGLPLGFTPTVLVSLRPSGGGGGRPGYAVRGRTVTGQVQLEAGGAGWRTRSTARVRLWRELVVHELFHLWNSQVAARADVRDEWLSEGASSFVAGTALVDAGLLDATRWGRRVVAAANRCARSLRGPLYDRAADPSYYDCGEVVHVALDRALAARGGLWPVYARLFADARARPSGAYATADFLALCAGAGAAPAIVAAVRAILDRGLGPDPQATLRALLADAGIATTVVPGRRGRPSRLRWQPSPRPRAGGSVQP
ncbi:MAG: hypothetical protein IPH80_33225 [Myxococcales bacterium]|nr:hypothetical protein [Myxococcales bacterium]MBP6848831.1 hypothetical protein [Kofleriaceae bacterium]